MVSDVAAHVCLPSGLFATCLRGVSSNALTDEVGWGGGGGCPKKNWSRFAGSSFWFCTLGPALWTHASRLSAANAWQCSAPAVCCSSSLGLFVCQPDGSADVP